MSSRLPETQHLLGRVALVTGGAGHLGSAMVEALIEAGADVAIAYHGNREGAERLAKEARASGRRAVAVRADLHDPESIDAVIDTSTRELGPLDILVANAGAGMARSWEQVGAAEFDEALALNLRAPYLLAKGVLPGMMQRSWGRILFVSSVAAMVGGPFGPDYSAGKAGLHGLAHYLAPQVASAGVTVNVLAPALVGEHTIEMMDDAVGRAFRAAIPVGRLGDVGEFADFALAILRNGYLTNKVLTIDGGLLPR